MQCFKIEGGNPLVGTVSVCGAKNAVLPEIAAAVLSEERVVLQNVPPLSDLKNMIGAAKLLGVKCRADFEKNQLEIDAGNILPAEIPYEQASRLRTSFLFAGPLLARFGYMKISMPGGCAIGNRPIDLHLKGLELMGANIVCDGGFVEGYAENGLHGAEIYLDFPSVGATENLMLAACLAKGRTVIQNAAAEPEICDLADFLREMGAEIQNDGSDKITVEGVTKLHGAVHTVMPDRIEAGTYMIAAATAGGDVLVKGILPEYISPVCAKLTESGVEIIEGNDYVRVISECGHACHIKSIDVKTMPYPGFPTDLQAQITAFLTGVDGTGVVTETVFENRFNHVCELCRMGASIKVEGRTAVIAGGKTLSGTVLRAPDLRAGAGLAIAALAAKGVTTLYGVEHIDRGYYDLEGKMSALGANFRRCRETPDFDGNCMNVTD